MLALGLVLAISATPQAVQADWGHNEFYGVVQSMPESGLIGTWIINGMSVEATADTQFHEDHGPLQEGAFVHVEGQWHMGTFTADVIETASLPGPGDGQFFQGVVDSMPSDGLVGEWVISGMTFVATTGTSFIQMHGPLEVGATVNVHYSTSDDGTNYAIVIATTMHSGHPGQGYAHYYGTVEAMPANGFVGTWTISGVDFEATSDTYFNERHGALEVGANVVVIYYTQGDVNYAVVVATRRHEGDPGVPGGHYLHYYGTVESMPANGFVGTWVVDDLTVEATDDTYFEEAGGPLEVGANVMVVYYTQDDTNYAVVIATVPCGGGGSCGGYTHIYGEVVSMPADGFIGEWVIGDQTITATEDTYFEEMFGSLEVGTYVHAVVYDDNGVLTAAVIATAPEHGGGGPRHHAQFYGYVDEMPTDGFVGTWIISGVTVEATADTEFNETHGPLQVGAFVHVRGITDQGTFVATRIATVEEHGGPGVPTNAWVIAGHRTASLDGGPFTVNIYTVNVNDLGGFEMNVGFDPTIVQAQDVTIGDFLGSTGRTVVPLGPAIDNDAGTIYFGAATTGDTAGPDGQGILATITFTPIASGHTRLALSDVLLSDTQSISIAVRTRDGQIAIPSGLPGDMNGDCQVDVIDVASVANSWGHRQGDMNFDPGHDMDHNGRVDVMDVMNVAGHWGEQCSTGTGGNSGGSGAGKGLSLSAGDGQASGLALRLGAARREGHRFSVPVLAQLRGVGGFELSLGYRPDKARLLGVELSDWLADNGNTWAELHAANAQAGVINVAGYSFGNAAGANGKGILLKLYFDARPNLALLNAIASDQQGNAVPVRLPGADR